MKYHIITYGCQMNESDSQRIAAQLESKGNTIVSDASQAKAIVINICSIRQSSVNRVLSRIEKIRLLHPKTKIILTGCILEKDKKKFENLVDEIRSFADLEIPVKDPRLVPIMTGCNNFCSYCVVPYTRGREKSRKACHIIKDVKKSADRKVGEITLLGQNVNSYKSGKTDFPQLLDRIQKIPGEFKIKFISNHPKDFSDTLIESIAKNDKISKEIHLPVQSGNNVILKKMNRKYTVGRYKKIIKKIRKKIPDARISTDIIVGFPTETEKQFLDTIKLIKEIEFSQIYVASYSPRIGTAAFKIKDDITSQEKKRRKRIVLKLIKETCKN